MENKGRWVLIAGVLISFLACSEKETDDELVVQDPSYRSSMRQLVIDIADYARATDSDFLVIPQNGHELLTTTGMPAGAWSEQYVAAINGQAREELFYGYDNQDDEPTPAAVTSEWQEWLDRYHSEQSGTVLITDYCSTVSLVNDSYGQNDIAGFISMAADDRELGTIPAYPSAPHGENDNDILSLDQAQNFLYLINTANFSSKSDFVNALTGTNYDLLIVDAFYEDEPLSPSDLNALKQKANGGSRLVIAYMSIGEAEDYRWYWQSEWSTQSPEWLGDENADWVGNFMVHYWDPNWQQLIYGNDNSYTSRILNAGFDGVYLDIIDAYEYWE